ncbi:MAG: hypothetical protein HY756_06475 [Nitrospirae bacterium]|nr:hypothetical protein [Nitrospirota bacterium]
MNSLSKKSLFWDVDRGKLSPEKDWYFIIERILEFGDIDDVLWMESTFPREEITDTVKESRILSKRTRSYCKAAGYAS